MGDALCDQLLVDVDGEFQLPSDAEDLFRILETWEDCVNGPAAALRPTTGAGHGTGGRGLLQAAPAPGNKGSKRRTLQDEGDGTAQTEKRQRCSPPEEGSGTAPKTPHITVERNRRKQMNEHLTVLRSLMPCFYVKRVSSSHCVYSIYLPMSIYSCIVYSFRSIYSCPSIHLYI
jgi:hypothetical protein